MKPFNEALFAALALVCSILVNNELVRSINKLRYCTHMVGEETEENNFLGLANLGYLYRRKY